jgi:acetate kinase
MSSHLASLTCLILNAGSSSIRFALYEIRPVVPIDPALQLRGKVERIGLTTTTFSVTDADGASIHQQALDERDFLAVMNRVLDWITEQTFCAFVQAVGHRLVHGCSHQQPLPVTPFLLEELNRLIAFAPQHLPNALALMTAITQRFPHWQQVACFDTAFHAQMPTVAQRLPIPRRYTQQGVQRYGFHGLSYAYLMEALARLGDPAAKNGRVILAHLGNGASMAAVRDGKSIDTSMGFTPASGLMMGSRSGDIDPGLMTYFAQQQQMTITEFDHMVNHQSGLLGLSETSADVRDLLAIEAQDVRALEAIALFCYQAKKCIGAYAAALGGIDTLVFSGGIGENAPLIRERICQQLEFLGIELSAVNNKKTVDNNAAIISSNLSRVTVRVIATDEAWIMARYVGELLVV